MATDEPDGRNAFDSAFEAHFDYVCHTLRRLGVRNADLEDAAQDVFLAVFRRFEQYDPTSAMRPWLVGFAFRVASNYRRTQRRRKEDIGSDEPPPASVDGRLAAERAEMTRRIQQVLDAMSLERSVVLLMFDMDGHTAPEIAEALELPLNTVYSRIRLARGDFRTIGGHLFAAEASGDG